MNIKTTGTPQDVKINALFKATEKAKWIRTGNLFQH